jgi:hypothetical protein
MALILGVTELQIVLESVPVHYTADPFLVFDFNI